MTIPVVWSPETRRHEPMREVWVGVPTEGTEVPARVDRILEALAAHEPVDAVPHDDDVLTRVHDPAYVAHLRTIHAEWSSGPYDDLVGQDRVVPYVFPTPAMTQGMPPTRAAATHGRAGEYGYDTMTLVGPGTWEAARAAVDCALTAVDLVAGPSVGDAATARRTPCAGRPATTSPVRATAGPATSTTPPSPRRRSSTPATPGSRWSTSTPTTATAPRRSSGTRSDVLYASTHVDPAAGWFPHYFGHAHETGSGDGEGATLNLPLPEGTTDAGWLEAVAALAERAAEADALVVSLGVDAAADDPESPLLVTAEGYAAAGRLLGSLGLPAAIVQEGGYHLPSLGGLVAAYLDGHAES